jgi:hypothetical protein
MLWFEIMSNPRGNKLISIAEIIEITLYDWKSVCSLFVLALIELVIFIVVYVKHPLQPDVNHIPKMKFIDSTLSKLV